MLRAGEGFVIGSPFDENVAAVVGVRAEDHACEFGAARTHQAEETEYLAFVQVEGDVFDNTRRCNVLDA